MLLSMICATFPHQDNFMIGLGLVVILRQPLSDDVGVQVGIQLAGLQFQ